MVKKLFSQSLVKIIKNRKILVLFGLNTAYFFCECWSKKQDRAIPC